MTAPFPPPILHKEGKWFVAECPATGVASQGRTAAAALKNLQQARGLYLEEFPRQHDLTDR